MLDRLPGATTPRPASQLGALLIIMMMSLFGAISRHRALFDHFVVSSRTGVAS
jgi:hypothetical protein